MAGGDHSQDANNTPEPVEKGFATLNQIQYVKSLPESAFFTCGRSENGTDVNYEELV